MIVFFVIISHYYQFYKYRQQCYAYYERMQAQTMWANAFLTKRLEVKSYEA